MSDITRFCLPFLLNHMEVQPGSRILDIGGSDGELCQGLVKLQPRAEYTVLDQGERPTQERGISYLEGDFFAHIPAGFDHLFLKNILHDWSDEDCLTLLRNCTEATMSAHRLTIIEVLLPEASEANWRRPQEFSVDWNIFATLPGRERRLSEYEGLLQESGWSLVEAKSTATPFWVIEAVRQ